MSETVDGLKATFDDFIAQNPNFKKFADDEDMKIAFNFLSVDTVIIQMVDASEASKPALTPVVEVIESIFTEPSRVHQNTLDDNFTKQAVGLMIKTILDPFGYSVWRQRYIPKKTGTTKFQTASVYHRDPTKPVKLNVVKKIEVMNIQRLNKQVNELLSPFGLRAEVTPIQQIEEIKEE